MEITIRRVRDADLPSLPAIFRDANNTLRKSRGGLSPDSEIDSLNSKSDAELLKILCRGAIIFVAEVNGTSRLAGMGALTDNLPARLMNSTSSRSHYVREAFQKGKAGVSVGRLLREATIAEAKRRGFRKMYGFSTPEAAGFHRKFVAVFHPEYDTTMSGLPLKYYEIELRRSVFNGVRVEPYVHRAGMLFGAALKALRGGEKAARE